MNVAINWIELLQFEGSY